MIVVDASAMLEFLLQSAVGMRVEARLFRDQDELHVPHLLDVEVLQGFRRLVRMGEVSPGRADEVIVDLSDLDVHRHAHLDLLPSAADDFSQTSCRVARPFYRSQDAGVLYVYAVRAFLS